MPNFQIKSICRFFFLKTGLDPLTRRHIWQIISRAKQTRAVLLTSHSLDEIEVLSNRIGILAKGDLKCLGSAQHLANKFGEGYILSVNFKESDKQRVEKFIKENFPNCQIEATYRGNLQYSLDKSVKISRVFSLFNEANAGISDWAITQRGLESIFEKIVKDSHKDEDKKN